MLVKETMIFLVSVCLSLLLIGQSSAPLPNIWFKTTTIELLGRSYLINHNDTLETWGHTGFEALNFHAVPTIDPLFLQDFSPLFFGNTGATVFSIYQPETKNQEHTLWSLEDGENIFALASNYRFYNGIDSTTYLFSGVSSDWLRLSTHFMGKSTKLEESYRFRIGSSQNNSANTFTGVLPEILVFNNVLSKTQRKQVESYLAAKYGIPLLAAGKLEYINSKGATYWSAAANKIFRHRPTVIGRDDFWSLYQRQATNAYESNLITIGLGAIESLNSNNNRTLPDLSFLLWTDNNAALALSGTNDLLARCWEMSVVDTGLAQTTLRLGVRQVKEELSKSERFWLAIDRSGENTFSLSTTDYYSPSPSLGSREYVFYENIEWDTDRSGQDNFTFLKGGEMILVLESVAPNCSDDHLGSLAMKAIGGTPPYRYRLNGVSGSTSWSGEMHAITDLPGGNYLLSVTDANGLVCEKTIDLHYADLSPMISLNANYELNDNTPLKLAVPPSCLDCNYHWLLPNGNNISSNEITLTQPGRYGLQIKKGDCIDTHFFTVTQPESSPFQSVELWGNPSQEGVYTLEIRLWKSMPVTLMIFRESGQLVSQQSLPLTHYHKISGAGLTAGTYRIQVKCNDQIVTKTLITL